MNLIIEKRDGHISKYNSEIEKLECDVKILSENLREIQNNSIIKSAEMIHAATKKSSEFLDEQIKIIKKENEELLNGIKKRLEEEIKSLDSAFKTQIEITSQIIFNKLLERKI
jgi:F0F1-type ATP synthase membrane subunit b/b'